MNRRALLRLAGPALALPIVSKAASATPVDNKVLVSQEELIKAFDFAGHGVVTAESFNRRFQIIISLFFEQDPQKIRGLLDELKVREGK